MISYKLKDGDLVITNGAFELNSNIFATAQLIETRLKTVSKEWFLDANEGIDYFNKVFVDKYDLTEIEAIFKTEILETTNVVALLDFNLEFANRNLAISFKCSTIFEDNIEDVINVRVA